MKSYRLVRLTGNPKKSFSTVLFIHASRNVRRILVRGVNAPLPPGAKKILKI